MLKKLKEKEPFYASVYKHNVLKNKKKVKINKFTMGIELRSLLHYKKRIFLILKKKLLEKQYEKDLLIICRALY